MIIDLDEAETASPPQPPPKPKSAPPPVAETRLDTAETRLKQS